MKREVFKAIARALGGATSTDELAGPLLETLELATGLETTYFAVVDPDRQGQYVLSVRGPPPCG